MRLVALEDSGIISPASQVLGTALHTESLLERADIASLAQSSATSAQEGLSERHGGYVKLEGQQPRRWRYKNGCFRVFLCSGKKVARRVMCLSSLDSSITQLRTRPFELQLLSASLLSSSRILLPVLLLIAPSCVFSVVRRAVRARPRSSPKIERQFQMRS